MASKKYPMDRLQQAGDQLEEERLLGLWEFQMTEKNCVYSSFNGTVTSVYRIGRARFQSLSPMLTDIRKARTLSLQATNGKYNTGSPFLSTVLITIV